MIALVVIAAAAAFGLAVLIAKALVVDEARGRVQRRLSRHLETTIASLPEPVRDEWAEEWRNELAAITTMPFTAASFVRHVRQSASQMVGEPQFALALRRPGLAGRRDAAPSLMTVGFGAKMIGLARLIRANPDPASRFMKPLRLARAVSVVGAISLSSQLWFAVVGGSAVIGLLAPGAITITIIWFCSWLGARARRNGRG
jgi:hypothetical protein